MKRDMELCRKILLEIEEQYVDESLYLQIDGYTVEAIAYHCRLLHEAGLLLSFDAQYANDHLYNYEVGPLTWEGHNFLDEIREDTVWGKTKDVIKKEGLPFVWNVTKTIASSILSAMTEGAVNALKK